MANDITYIGQVNYHRDRRRFGIRRDDRLMHIHIIGKTGVGKSTLLRHMALQDYAGGEGFALIDPHGDLVEELHQEGRRLGLHEAIYLDAADPEQPYGYNPLRQVRPEFIPLAASGLLEVLKKMWADAWGVRMEHILRNCLYALLEQPDATLSDIGRLLNDRSYRKQIASSLANEAVRRFWTSEFDRYSFGYRADGAAAIQNKVGAFLADPLIRRILTEPKEPISLRRIMDEGKVLLVNLSKGRIGEDSAALLGGLLVTTIGLAAFSRADSEPADRRDFFVYLDEFQTWTTLAVANMLSELRKYRVGLTLAHQYLHQLDPDIRHAVLGNAATLIVFRVGAEDASYVGRELLGAVDERDLQSLENRHMFVRLLVNGEPCKPFSAVTSSRAGPRGGESSW
ncbi:MAG: type IV secretion system DNA-binding domain-containing protein [Enhydrobacter sp.]|nr:MAG: type IV secretion system DNA-binding domain-containing protein [Enhydrobacter sp.]